jgi:azurin
MHQRWLAFILLASAPLLPTSGLAQAPAAGQSAPAAQKPAPSTAKPAAKGVRTVEIIGTDDMKYSVTNIDAKPGEQLRVRLVTKGAMPKIAMALNFVLLKKDASQIKFVNASAVARESNYIAPEMKDQVIAATALAGAGETVEVTFKVPAAAGQYPYVCSFPGHFQAGMRGTLTVK